MASLGLRAVRSEHAGTAKALNERLTAMAQNFALAGPASAEIIALQGTGKLKSAVEEQLLTNRFLEFDGYDVVAMFGFPPQLGYGGLFAPGTKDGNGQGTYRSTRPGRVSGARLRHTGAVSSAKGR